MQPKQCGFEIFTRLLCFGALALCFARFSLAGEGAYSGPVIDMHLHAFPADGNGPPPVAVCAGLASSVRYDPATPWPEFFGRLMADPPCENPIWGAKTDEAVRDETIAAMRRLKVRGVLSGTREGIADWQAAGPGLFIKGRGLNIERDKVSAAEIEREFESGSFEVLAEVTNQYSGILADDARFAEYWEVAARHDIPVGIHLGVGPPGVPMLYREYRLQSPLRIEPVLRRHPSLRVYLMHAGYPFLDDLLAMLYAYPQLHVGTGVLQVAAPREDYYRFLEAVVRAGFIDRIMFGSDQMNWPGLIEEGINAINDAPFLTAAQKQMILHDNAERFLRLKGEP